jgi:hypothetical protein
MSGFLFVVLWSSFLLLLLFGVCGWLPSLFGFVRVSWVRAVWLALFWFPLPWLVLCAFWSSQCSAGPSLQRIWLCLQRYGCHTFDMVCCG